MGRISMKFARQILIWSLICTVIMTIVITMCSNIVNLDFVVIRPWRLLLALVISNAVTTFILTKNSRY